jgi:hypothetical protein
MRYMTLLLRLGSSIELKVSNAAGRLLAPRECYKRNSVPHFRSAAVYRRRMCLANVAGPHIAKVAQPI